MFLWLIFAVFLFVVCAVMLVLEIFVPSFGLITILALCCLAGGGAIFFHYGLLTGWVGVGIAAVVVPLVWVFAYRRFPKTSFGRQVTLGRPDRDKGDAVPDNERLTAMHGKVGTAITPLRPVGTCDFSGYRVECVAETGYIEKDSKIKVIHIDGSQLTVRIAEKDDK